MRSSHLRQRRHERGAALVEAAFMFPMFVLLFFSIIYAHSFSATQIDVNTQARELAWTDAMTNCVQGGGGDDEKETLPDYASDLSVQKRGNFMGTGQTSTTAITTSANAPAPLTLVSSGNDIGASVSSSISGGSVEGALGTIVNLLSTKLASVFPNPNGTQAVGKGNVSWRLPNNYAAMNPTNSTAKMQTVTVMCDEKPQTGSPKAVVEDLFSDVASFVSSAL